MSVSALAIWHEPRSTTGDKVVWTKPLAWREAERLQRRSHALSVMGAVPRQNPIRRHMTRGLDF
jgi:hypothetical protein